MDLVENTSSPSGETAQVIAPEAAVKSARAQREMPWSFPVVVFGGVALLLFVFLGQFASLVRTQYKIVSLRDKQRNLEREKIDLQLQIQQLTSLERVERIASGRLKMVPPANRQIVDISANAVHGKLAQSDPAPAESGGAQTRPAGKKILQ